MATPQELADKIKQIEGTLSKLNARERAYYQDQLINLKASTSELEKFETLFRDVVNAANDLNSELSYIYKSFKDSVAELSKQNTELSSAKSALSSISKIAQEIVYENSQGVLIEGKTLDKLEKKAKLQFQNLQVAIQSGRIEGDKLEEIKGQAEEQKTFFEALQGVRKEQEKIKKNAGIKIFTGLDAISNAIPGLGKFSSAFQDASKAAQETAIYNQKIYGTTKGLTDKEIESLKTGKGISDELKTRLGLVDKHGKLLTGAAAKQKAIAMGIPQAAEKAMSPMMAGIKSLGPALAKALGPLALLKELVDAFKLVDGLTGDLAKGMNMSYQDASFMSAELNSAANTSGDIFVTTKGMQESLLAINKTLGTNVMLNKEDLATMTKFRTTAGLTNEELAGIYKLTLGTNKSLEDATGEVLAQARISSTRLGVALNEKEVLKEIKDVSAATTLSLGKNPSLIAEAVAVAKSLGLEMSKIDAIAESLLNFQSSIESELEAELLTGRQLNLEQARYYALTNDVAGLAEEINKNLGSSTEFGKMNRLQQEAIAKSVGMNREELAKTLFIQDQLKGVSGEEVEKRKELLNSLTEQYGIEGAQKMLKEKSIEDLENQASIQDRFNASVEKLREIFVTVAEAIMPAFDLLSSIFSIVGLMLKPLGGLINWGKSFGDVMGVIVGLLTAAGIAALVLNSSLTFGVGAAIALAAAGAGMAYLEKNKNQANKAGDILSPAKGKTTVSTKEGGLFELSPNDDLVAAPGISNKIGKSKESTSIMSSSINIQPLAERLDRMNQLLTSILNKEGNVSIDGNLVGKTLALAEYRTGS
jgi:hypothetical protein